MGRSTVEMSEEEEQRESKGKHPLSLVVVERRNRRRPLSYSSGRAWEIDQEERDVRGKWQNNNEER